MDLLIESNRLLLPLLSVPTMEALLSGDRSRASQLLGYTIPPSARIDQMPLERRLEQIRADASVHPWLLRAMVERASGQMIGRIGFHGPPGAVHLAKIAPDGVELGYATDSHFQRRGFASEAALALMHGAYAKHGQRCFVLSISPENVASNAMAKSLGFSPVGSHIDEEDGLEVEFVRRIDTWPEDWQERLGK